MLEQGKPVVKNAADPKQVKSGKKKAKLRREQELFDLKALLETPQGRRVMWRLLAKAGMFNSIYESSSRIYYNAGRQDYGFWLWSELEKAHKGYLVKMIQENERKENEDV